MLAHKLTHALAARRKDGTLPWLRPDGKSQVSVVYDKGRPVEVDTVVLSTQHADSVKNKTIHEAVTREVIEAGPRRACRRCCPAFPHADAHLHANPSPAHPRAALTRPCLRNPGPSQPADTVSETESSCPQDRQRP